MEELLLHIVDALRQDPQLDARQLERIIHEHSNALEGDQRFAKRQLMPFYLHIREQDPQRWRSWGIDAETERLLLRLIQMKPRRTASGVATITVITKPHACSGTCLFCPNDVRMPKSYLHDEPACQRAERNCFDPYLQVAARLNTLQQMGHPTDKVELIVLGGTWSDYPQAYQLWFASELLRALNEGGDAAQVQARRAQYEAAGITGEASDIAQAVEPLQAAVSLEELSYNAAVAQLYGAESPWRQVEAWQQVDFGQLEAQQHRNEEAAHRCVGLVVETRPDLVTTESLTLLRRLGCTKVQVGVQTLDAATLARCNRRTRPEDIQRAFGLLRLFGFKVHAHFMVNLPSATPEGDKRDFREFVQGAPYQPDEVKLYPCALVRGSALERLAAAGEWRPYDEDTLVDVLAADVRACPPFVRISRMIRDFSAHDIVAGNKKTNLRQLVEQRLQEADALVQEMRFREIGTRGASVEGLRLQVVPYETACTSERFLQWVTPEGRIAGFLRLSLPYADALQPDMPIAPGEAMIREVHVYGKVARLREAPQGAEAVSHTGARQAETAAAAPTGAQHLGLGRALVATACDLAREAGYGRINVISAIGTRGYYRRLGFRDAGLYQQKPL